MSGKNIIVCSDGTGNRGIKARGTNVYKLYESLNLIVHYSKKNIKNHHKQQEAFYDDGVGNSSFLPLKILGGAFGYGVSANIRELYRAIARIYHPGDSIFLFGFSRGAYTVRVLAGLISECGILDLDKCIRENKTLNSVSYRALKVYRKRFKSLFGIIGNLIHPKETPEVFRKKYSVHSPIFEQDYIPEIKFIGAWDTVGAVAFPIGWVKKIINLIFYKVEFKNKRIKGNIKNGCHALSLDDERKTFHPILWDETGLNDDQRIEQVWFAGVHSNVGGGYKKHGISLVSLDWMMNRVKEIDPEFEFIEEAREYINMHRNVNDKLYNSRAGANVYYRYQPRFFNSLFSVNNWQNEFEKMGLNQIKIHFSVFERVAQSPDGYNPGAIPANIKVVKDSEDIDVEGLEKTWGSIVKEDIPGYSLMQKKPAAFLIELRRIAHTNLLLLTAAIGYFMYTGGVYDINNYFSMTNVEGFISVIRNNMWLIPWIIFVLLIGFIPRIWLRSIFEKFWIKHRGKIMKYFDVE